MAKEIKHLETLVYYDGLQLFVGVDQVDTQYLCVLVEQHEKEDTYLGIPISRERLKSFKLGEIDLKDLYVTPHIEELYFIKSDDILGKKLMLKQIAFKDISSLWIPEAGFFYEAEPQYDEIIKKQAQETKSAILHLVLNPPEARDANKISPENLARVITVFQSLIKYAFKKAISNLEEQIKRTLDISENYKLDVISTSGGGSFTVHLQSKKHADLFGYSDVERAFRIIDSLSNDLSDNEALLNNIKQYKGHCANTYIKLLETVIKNDMPMSYSWAMPGIDEIKTKTIYKSNAKSAYDSLVSTEELTSETVQLIGGISKADYKTGRWTLISDEDNKEYHGELSEKSKVTLKGIVIKTKIYKFFCEETIEEITGTGREKKKLVLIEYEVLN